MKQRKYVRRESSKSELLRMTRKLFKRNLELTWELSAWREFKKALVEQLRKELRP